MGGFGGRCAGGDTDREPLGGAADAAPDAAASRDAQCDELGDQKTAENLSAR